VAAREGAARREEEEARPCTVDELAALVPTSPETLLARLRSRPTQRGLDRVLDEEGQPVRIPSSASENVHRPITAYELAQLMPFEFDDEEMKAMRRRRAPARDAVRHGSVNADALAAFARAAEGLDVAVLRSLRKRVWAMRGTPQAPVDWSDPDQWIPERLDGPEKDAALVVWERSAKTVNPRYMTRPMRAVESLRILATTGGKYVLTERGRAFLGGDLSVIKESPETGNGRSRPEVCQEFWELFVSKSLATGSRFGTAQPQRSDWIQKNAGMRGVAYNVAVRQHHTLVELYIDGQRSRDNNLRILEELREHQPEIEAAFGGALEWDVKPGRRAMRVACEFETGGYIDTQSLADIADELLDGFSRFEGALQPFIDAMAPEQSPGSGWQARDRCWTEEEYIAAVQATSPENTAPARAILQWAHHDPRVTVEGGWGAQFAGVRLRTSRPDDKASEHSFINLYANSADNASAEVQFASMARREPFVGRAQRVELLSELSAIATST